MANGRPTSLRMGFGGREAFQSGMRGFRVPSTSQINASVGWEREQNEIREIVAKHPELGILVREMITAQTAKQEWCTTYILQALHGRLAQKKNEP
jgi:hypothetical protein